MSLEDNKALRKDIRHVSGQNEFDRIWALFQETREQMKENERMLTAMFRENDAKMINILSLNYGKERR
ncbi:MAG: hypothetical protein HN417_08260 [Desulfobacula sp.]|jgi:hypothetical protein|nr:hypothetical protein [Desulfobacula sp.]